MHVTQRNKFYRKLIDSLHAVYQFRKKYDIKNIQTDYLIKNIDEAFRVWESYPWGKHYKFQLFCEYVLPYRIDTEQLSSWRQVVNDRYSGIFDKIYYEGGTRYEAENAHLEKVDFANLYSASGFKAVKMFTKRESLIEFKDIHCGTAGDKIIIIRYYNGGANAQQQLIVNGKKIKRLTFLNSGDWKTPQVNLLRIPVSLNAKGNVIQLEMLRNDVSIDYIEIASSTDYNLNNISKFVSGGIYKIKNKYSGTYLTIENKRIINHLSVAPNFLEGEQQKFILNYKDYGFYNIHPFSDISKTLDISHLSRENNSEVIISQDYDRASQKWALIPLDSGYFKIVNKNSSKCIEIRKKVTKNEIQIIQREFNGAESQQWEFELMTEINDSIFHITPESGIEASCRTMDVTLDFQWYILNGLMPSINAVDLINERTGNCREETQFLTYLSRGSGIPMATDFTQWPDHAEGHAWNVIMDQNGRAVKYYFRHKPNNHTIFDDRKKSKVFRKLFSKNPKSLVAINSANEELPEFFQDPHIVDVTNEYAETTDVIIPMEFEVPNNTHFAYLCTFNDKRWVPIHWGRIKNGKAVFKNMGRNVVYLPTFYSNNGLQVAGHVFRLTNQGEIQMLIPDHNKKQKMILDRKYPIAKNLHSIHLTKNPRSLHRRLIGGRFQGANKLDFSDAVTLFKFKKKTEGKYVTLAIENKTKFKYLRYIGADNTYCTINEIIFFDEDNREIEGKIIGTQGSFKDKGSTHKQSF